MSLAQEMFQIASAVQRGPLDVAYSSAIGGIRSAAKRGEFSLSFDEFSLGVVSADELIARLQAQSFVVRRNKGRFTVSWE